MQHKLCPTFNDSVKCFCVNGNNHSDNTSTTLLQMTELMLYTLPLFTDSLFFSLTAETI